MTQNAGTLVIAPIRPNDSADVYPSAHAIDILGGWKAVANAAARVAIPVERLESGSVCWQVDSGVLYRWDGAAWVVVTLGGAATSIDLSTATITNTLPAVNIGNNTVSNAKLAQMPTLTIKGNNTGGTANALDLTVAQTTAMLAAMVGDSGSGGTKGLAPAPGAGDAAANKFLHASGAYMAARDTFLANEVRAVLSSINTGRGLRYVSALDKIFYVEGALNGRIVAIDPITDYPITTYTSTKTPKTWCYAANANLAASRIWIANGTTDLFSVNPNTWALDVASAGSRTDYIVYSSVNGTLWGFDNNAFVLREYNATTGAQIGANYGGGAISVANGNENPMVYVAANNSIYYTDLFGVVKRFNCTSHAVTILGTLHAGADSSGGVMLGSDGLLYFTNAGSGADKYKIKVVDPATDTVTATIDMSTHLNTLAGFMWCYEWRGYLYVGCAGSSPVGIVLVIDFTTRALTASITAASLALTNGMAASPSLSRAYIAAVVTVGFTSYLAVDR